MYPRDPAGSDNSTLSTPIPPASSSSDEGQFLPPAAVRDEAALTRFRNEVRIVRQVSHRNGCRVYDIGKAAELVFLSMEYVDGEDLAALLRRIGHLPPTRPSKSPAKSAPA
jgi:serine/threonine protein kinase